MIWSPTSFPSNEAEFCQLLEQIGSTPICYWEGDTWGTNGRKKEITSQMKWWLSASEAVFTVAGSPQTEIFRNGGAKVVKRTLHTYCHLKFARYESNDKADLFQDSDRDIIMIANNLMSLPIITGLPGSLRRFELATRITLSTDVRFGLFGKGWPTRWSNGTLDYSKQIEEIRKSRISVNWDHFDNYEGYASDRLPIALLSGRPHVTTFHKGMDWLSANDLGVFQEDSPAEVLSRAKDLLSQSPRDFEKAGMFANNWATRRLSHREAARHIISYFENKVSRPPTEPWNSLG